MEDVTLADFEEIAAWLDLEVVNCMVTVEAEPLLITSDSLTNQLRLPNPYHVTSSKSFVVCHFGTNHHGRIMEHVCSRTETWQGGHTCTLTTVLPGSYNYYAPFPKDAYERSMDSIGIPHILQNSSHVARRVEFKVNNLQGQLYST